jgi:hypothetical protein
MRSLRKQAIAVTRSLRALHGLSGEHGNPQNVFMHYCVIHAVCVTEVFAQGVATSRRRSQQFEFWERNSR